MLNDTLKARPLYFQAVPGCPHPWETHSFPFPAQLV